MSMTELYGLSVVAEFGFRKGCEAIESTSDDRRELSPKCVEAVVIVGSLCRLIAALWRQPSLERDAPSVLRAFDYDNGSRRVSGLQKMIHKHIMRLRSICSMQDADVLDLGSNVCSRARKSQLAKLRSSCLLARRCVDKPNVHRLLELGYATVPMVGYI